MAPKVGETRKKINGKTERWTGKRWVEQTQPIKNLRNLINKTKLFAGNKNKPNKSHYETAKKNNNNRPNPKQDEINKVNKNIKNAKGWNKEQLEKKKKHLEKFGKSRTWSNPVGAEGGGKPSKVDTSKTKKKSKWIKTSKGTLAKRGSVSARRAENKEAARNRAKEMAKKRIAAKKKKLKV